MADPLVSLVDTVFIGRLGGALLAALGIATALLALGYWIFIFLAYGITPLVSHAIGEGQEARAARLISNGLIAAVGLGAAVALLLVAAAEPLTRVMGAVGEVQQGAVAYIRIRGLATPAVLIILLGHGAFRGHQNTRTPLIVSLGLNAVNLMLDPILIFVLDWGLAGAAVATLVAQWAGAAGFVYLMHDRLGLRIRQFDRGGMWTLLRVGRDVIVRAGALVIIFTTAARISTAIGDAQIAAHQIAMQLLILTAHIADALAIAAQALLASFIGRNQGEDALALSSRLLTLGALLGMVLFGLLALGRSLIPTWFSTDPVVIGALEEIWLILAALQLLAMPVYVSEGIVMGASDFGYLARAVVIAVSISLLVMVLVIPLNWGLSGVWWGIAALNLLRGAALWWWHFGSQSRFGRLLKPAM